MTIKPRNPFFAIILSLLFPGLGQVYNGEFRKGVLFYGLVIAFPIIFGLTRFTTFFYGLCSLIILEIFLRIYIVVDAYYRAKKQNQYNLKSYNKWFYYLFIALIMLSILWVVDIKSMIGVESFSIPTSSNLPGIQPGDRLIGDMNAYKNKLPSYGDLVVFRRKNGQVFTYRVLGLPNDHLDLINDIITINGKASQAVFIRNTMLDGIPAAEFEEVLPNGCKHRIYRYVQAVDSTKTTIRNIVVPPDCYYLLGDNRDNAADSRYEGFIERKRILGRIVYSLWGNSLNRVNIDFRNE